LKERGRLHLLGDRLHDPNLWHLNRRSVAGAFALGLFVAFLPIPFQMLMAAAGALWLRVHLPISVVTVWVSNPITMAPLFYFTYRVGLLVTRGHPPAELNTKWTLDTVAHGLADIWMPFVTGCLLTGAVAALLGYASVRLVWRIAVVNKMRRRRSRALSRSTQHSGTRPSA
jgi:hypothetical protein